MPKKKYSFKLKSNLSELDKLCEHLDNFGQRLGLSKKSIFESKESFNKSQVANHPLALLFALSISVFAFSVVAKPFSV